MEAETFKWFSDAKRDGFITPAEGGADLFVRHSGIAGTGFMTLPCRGTMLCAIPAWW